jgi:acetate kinase
MSRRYPPRLECMLSRVLAVNYGSSSLKFKLIDIADQGTQALAGGNLEGVAAGNSGVQAILRTLAEAGFSADTVDAVGHRVVHSGTLGGPVLIDAQVVSAIERASVLAPLHNAPALRGIREVRSALGSDTPMVAVFDTDFHRTMPQRAALYALPLEVSHRHGIRRFGFHGISHHYVALRYAEVAGKSPDAVMLVTLHLGNGCSATAIGDGKSVDTSMGFTPLEGLMMGTRSGDLDPALVSYLQAQGACSAAEIERLLNVDSGLLGVSGRTNDVRQLLEAEAAGDERAHLALEMFCYRVRKYVGAYLAALGGAEAVVFTGGIGEHAAPIRARICRGLEWAGLELDAQRNGAAIGTEARISADHSRLQAYVIPSDEELMIARETAACIARAGGSSGGRSR